MSYDLYFIPADAAACTPAAFDEHFRQRAHYELSEGQAWYQNEDTGVYFGFELSDEAIDDDEASPRPWVQFNLNLYRPPFFADEAAIELAAFVEAFGASVIDATDAELTVFSEATFRRHWDHGNDFAVRSVPAEAATTPFLLPRARLMAAWRWNYERARLQQSEGEYVFVPRICFLEFGGNIETTFVWTDAIPTIVPRVDAVLFYRAELAPKKLFRRRPDVVRVPWADVQTLLGPPTGQHAGKDVWRATAVDTLQRIAAFSRAQPANTGSPKFIAADQVLAQPSP